MKIIIYLILATLSIIVFAEEKIHEPKKFESNKEITCPYLKMQSNNPTYKKDGDSNNIPKGNCPYITKPDTNKTNKCPYSGKTKSLKTKLT